MKRLIGLDDPRARDARVVGSKAAALAAALGDGLPVLPGWVVPAAASERAAADGAEALRASGPAAAILVVSGHALPPALAEDLRSVATDLGPSVVVRSSTLEESDPRWAGAFTSYLDVGPADVGTAVRGCWASVFSRDAVGRAAAIGVDPGGIRVGVLVQPWIAFEAGGTATVHHAAGVTVTAVTGPPADLLSGRRPGAIVEVGSHGDVTGDVVPAGLDDGALRELAELARAARATIGSGAIEWGLCDGEVVLLQARRAAASVARAAVPLRRRRSYPSDAERIAWLAERYPAPLGDELVLPWALGTSDLPVPEHVEIADRGSALAEALAVASVLVDEVWDADRGGGRARSAATIRALLGPDPEAGLACLAAAHPADPARAARVLGLLDALGHSLVDDGLLPHAEQVWRLTPHELRRAVAGGERPVRRRGPDRWEPFVASVVAARGEVRRGVEVSRGLGAGRVHPVRDPASSQPGPRRVLAVPAPFPAIAPLLWECSGLVSASGSPAAHLFEVARSLGVPAVIGVDLTDAAGDLAAVDGDAATVTRLPERTSRPALRRTLRGA